MRFSQAPALRVKLHLRAYDGKSVRQALLPREFTGDTKKYPLKRGVVVDPDPQGSRIYFGRLDPDPGVQK
jgi:hypothetical protein